MQFVATMGITFQMCILVKGQFGKSISYNKFLVLKVVCIYFLPNGTKLNQVTLSVCSFASAGGSRRGLFCFRRSLKHRRTSAACVCTIYRSFLLFFDLQNMYLKQLKN